MKRIVLFFLLSICSFANIYETKIDMERYPNSSIAILLDESQIKLNEDYSYEMTTREVKKILNYKGKKEHSEYKLYFDSRYEEIEIVNAFTIKENGEKIEVVRDEIKVLDSPDSFWKMEFAVEKVMVLSFKSVEVGDIVEIEYIRKNTKRDKLASKIIFTSSEALYKKKISIIYPEKLKLHIFETNFTDEIVKSEEMIDGKKKISYEMNNLIQYIYEEKMPRLSYIFPTIHYTMYDNWREYLAEIRKIYLDNLVGDIEVAYELQKAVDIKKDKYTQIEQLKDYFAKNIALIPINDLRSFELRPIKDIIEKKYGTSFERTLLFGIMLDYLGVDNRLIILGENKKYFDLEKEFIDISDFNYMIIEFVLDGKRYYVDPVSEFIKLDEFNEENIVGMPLGGKVDFIEIKSEKPNEKSSKTVILLDDVGDAKIDKKLSYTGMKASAIREKYKYMTEIDKNKDYESILSGISLNVEKISEKRNIDLGETAEISYSYLHKNFIIKTGEYEYFNLPIYMNPFRFNLPPDIRNYPIENRGEDIFKREIHLIIPENREFVDKPQDINLETDLFIIDRKCNVENGKLIIKDYIKYKENIITQEAYENIYKINLELSKKKQTRVLLKKKQVK